MSRKSAALCLYQHIERFVNIVDFGVTSTLVLEQSWPLSFCRGSKHELELRAALSEAPRALVAVNRAAKLPIEEDISKHGHLLVVLLCL